MWAGACHSELVKEAFRTWFSPSSVWYPVIKLKSWGLMESVVPLPARPPFWSFFLISVPLSGSIDAHSTITKSYPGRTNLSMVTLPSRRRLSPVTGGTRTSHYTLNISLGFWRNISSPGLGFCVMGWFLLLCSSFFLVLLRAVLKNLLYVMLFLECFPFTQPLPIISLSWSLLQKCVCAPIEECTPCLHMPVHNSPSRLALSWTHAKTSGSLEEKICGITKMSDSYPTKNDSTPGLPDIPTPTQADGRL